MNILSLFDGISCGRVALERAKIKITNYYASEIDSYAIKIAQKNYPNTIQLGDIKTIKSTDLPKINLIIGGSPCQGFSFAGKQLNFNDPRSKLFFEFIRLIKECQPKYFLLENVKMKKEYQNIITDYLKINPIEINSSLVSAQNRKRLYWTNIPNIHIPKDKGITLEDILELPGVPYCFSTSGRKNGIIEKRISSNKKAHCLTASGYSNRSFSGVITKSNNIRKLTPIECERLQTLPDNYTNGVSNFQRYKLLGNAWTIDILVDIFKNIKEINNVSNM